ncbi:MAG TPA: fibronectin type III-like domain-contianing protein, partial [Humibacillus sp.]|nr:fibronectin type III-like domain-contianing protein [Humibacillus sp.]
PQFVFGEGLTYTSVDWSDLSLDASELAPDDVVTAQVRLTNTGDRTAYEVVQVYVTDVVTSVTWAAKELKAFRRFEVPPGESVTASVEVPISACTIVDAAGRRVVEPGKFELLVGRSSRDADLQRARFTVHAPTPDRTPDRTTVTA